MLRTHCPPMDFFLGQLRLIFGCFLFLFVFMATVPENKIKNDTHGLKINFSIIPCLEKTNGNNHVLHSKGERKLKNTGPKNKEKH